MQSIGARIRKIRKLQARTLDQVASQSGITKSMLSKVETGSTVPAIATLSRIAAALGVSASSLLETGGQQTTLVSRAADIAPAKMPKTEKGYSFFTFASSRNDKVMQPYLFIASKNDISGKALSHGGEEFVYVLEGEMHYRVGSTRYTLREGDSLYFDAEEEHDLEPISRQVKYLAVFSDRTALPRAQHKKAN
jgi:quercetin dioxygenase-like cupin family protein